MEMKKSKLTDHYLMKMIKTVQWSQMLDIAT